MGGGGRDPSVDVSAAFVAVVHLSWLDRAGPPPQLDQQLQQVTRGAPRPEKTSGERSSQTPGLPGIQSTSCWAKGEPQVADPLTTHRTLLFLFELLMMLSGGVNRPVLLSRLSNHRLQVDHTSCSYEAAGRKSRNTRSSSDPDQGFFTCVQALDPQCSVKAAGVCVFSLCCVLLPAAPRLWLKPQVISLSAAPTSNHRPARRPSPQPARGRSAVLLLNSPATEHSFY